MSYISPAGFLTELRVQRDQALVAASKGNTTDQASLYTLLIVTVQEKFPSEESTWQDTFPKFFKTLRKTVKATDVAPASVSQVLAFLEFQEARLQNARLEQNPFAQTLLNALQNRMNELLPFEEAMNTWYVLHTMRQKALEEPDTMSRIHLNLSDYLSDLEVDSRWNDGKFLLGIVEGRKILDGIINVWKKGRN